MVDVGIMIFQIESINDRSKTLTIDVNLQLTWNDTRIQFKTDEKSYLRNNDFIKNCLWTPWDEIYVYNKASMKAQNDDGFRNRLKISKSENGVSSACPHLDY